MEQIPITPFVVAFGASAGGLQPILKTLSAVERDVPACFVICQHVSRSQPSRLKEILAHNTGLPVVVIKDNMSVENGHIYVPPQNRNVIVNEQNRFTVLDSEYGKPQPSVDLFFESIAYVFKNNALGIVLSGTGSDGKKGVVAIADAGGKCFAQSPTSCEHEAMPVSALATGKISLCLSPEELARVVADRSLYHKSGTERDLIFELRQLADYINTETGIDINEYRESMIYRRFLHCISGTQAGNLSEYLTLIKNDKKELHRFVDQVFVTVTEFFRDETVFDALNQALEQYLSQSQEEAPFRVWVVGCSTGEEAYSICILLLELERKLNRSINFQIFATDISTKTVEKARRARYTKDRMRKVSQQLREQYFQQDGEAYVINRAVRDRVLFSVHDVLNDPPFVKLNLISCRNLLIYFPHQQQQRVITSFAFAIEAGGFLLLGRSESIDRDNGALDCYSMSEKLFVRNSSKNNRHFYSSANTKSMSRLKMLGSYRDRKENSISSDLNTVLGEMFGPPAIVINDRGEIVYSTDSANAFLHLKEGYFSKLLVELIITPLKSAIKTLMLNARRQNNNQFSVEYVDPESILGEVRKVQLSLLEFKSPDNTNRILVIEPKASLGQPLRSEHDSPEVSLLESELEETRLNLQVVVEELETTNEELLASNEELYTLNEELLSSNEELNAANEELMVSNEEMQKLNQRLEEQNKQIKQMVVEQEIIESHLGVPILLVNQSGQIERFNSHIQKLLVSGAPTRGEELAEVQWNFPLPEKLLIHIRKNEDASLVLGIDVEDIHYKVNLLPIQIDDARQDWLISFYEVTEIRAAELLAEFERDNAYQTLAAIGDGIVRFDNEFGILFCNPVARIFIDSNQDTDQRHILKAFLFCDKVHHEPEFTNDILHSVTQDGFFSPIRQADILVGGRVVSIEYHISALSGQKDAQNGLFVFRDVTDEQRLISRVRHQANSLKRAQSLCQIGVCNISADNFEIAFSDEMCFLLSLDPTANIIQLKEFQKMLVTKSRKCLQTALEKAAEGQYQTCDLQIFTDNRTLKFFTFHCELYDGRILGVFQNISDRVAAESYSYFQGKNLETFLTHVAEAIVAIDQKGVIRTFNPAAETMFGYQEAEVLNKNVKCLMPDEIAKDHDDHLRNYQHTGKANVLGVTRELTGRKKDGTLFPIFLRAVEIDYADNDFTSAFSDGTKYLATIQDLTEWKNQEALVRRTQKMDAIGNLAGGIAHDFNNILGVISTNIELLSRSSQLSEKEKRERRLNTAMRSLGKAKKLTQKMLQLSKTETEAAEVCDARELVRNLVEFLENILGSDVKLDIGLCDDEALIYVDKADFEDAIMNLAINSKQAMVKERPGKISIDVSVNRQCETQPEGNKKSLLEYDPAQVCVKVSDNGTGIPKGLVERILDPFFSTKSKNEGTGLGLSMVYGFVQRSHGQIDIDTVEGQGSDFTLCFRRVLHKPPSAFTESESEDTGREKLGFKGVSILVVDDKLDLLVSLRDMLEAHGFIVKTMADPHPQLIEQLTSTPKIILCDVILGNSINGYQFAEKLTEKFQDARIIMMSGFTNIKPEQALSKSWPLLTKPFSEKQLLEVIQSQLQESRE